ncbi:T9SS type A sorting domain-containing protein [Epilithonimonas sp.]|uniref:T9SS type A sorting domain-containing protein n=1 Tax=Epilithonimonas sp. TaxID=2894511 RepID=UPI0028A2BE54|nr:T9SS type A sorting domain-containing protein [Epilithonimonas sp.]
MKKFFTIASMVLALSVNAQTPSWTVQNSNFPNASTYPFVMNSKGENVVWGLGADGSGGGADYNVFTKTSNGGTTWTSGQVTVPTGVSIQDIAAGDGNTAWVAGYDDGAGVQGIWKTTDGGSTWTRQATAAFNSAASFTNIVYFWDLNNGVALGDPASGGRLEVYTTTNGGTTWVRQTGAPALSGEYGYVHNKAVAGNTIWGGSNFGRIFRSNDRGVTWLDTVQSPLSDFGSASESGEIVLKDANTAWVMSIFGTLSKTVDAGVTFVPVDIQSGTMYPQSIAYVPGTDQTLLTGAASTNYGRGSSISFDGGVNWVEIANSYDDVGITSFAASSATAIWGGNFNNGAVGGINKLSPIQLATSEAGAVKGISIAPNPTFGDLNISTVLNIKSIEVLDMNGRVIKTFGSESKNLNLSTLQPGVYAVKVNTADGKSQITKFIKK